MTEIDNKIIQEKSRKVKFTYSTDIDLLNRLKIFAITNNQRTNELIDIILTDYLDRMELEKKESVKP